MVHTHSQNTETNQISLIDTCFMLLWCYSFFIMCASQHCQEKKTDNFQVNFSTITQNRTIIVSKKKKKFSTSDNFSVISRLRHFDNVPESKSFSVWNNLNTQNWKTKDLVDNDVIVCLTYSFLFILNSIDDELDCVISFDFCSIFHAFKIWSMTQILEQHILCANRHFQMAKSRCSDIL